MCAAYTNFQACAAPYVTSTTLRVRDSVQAEAPEALVEARDLAAAVDNPLGATGPHRVRQRVDIEGERVQVVRGRKRGGWGCRNERGGDVEVSEIEDAD